MCKEKKNNTKLPSLAKACGSEERLRRLTERDEEGNNFPPTEAFIHNVAIEIIEWAEKPDSYLLNEFYNPRGYTDDKLERWAKKYPVFGAAYDHARDVLGARRERKRIVENNCDHTLGEYNKKWRKRDEELHQRKLEIAAKKGQEEPQVFKLVHMSAEDCPEVAPAPVESSDD